MQKLNDDGVVNSSPTSVSSGYCSQWMSPNDYCFSKQSASERTLCTESEFESDNGVNQKLLREFHCIRPKTRSCRSKLLPSGVQVAKKKLICARQHRKSLHHESKESKCVLLRLNSTSFPYGGHVVPSSFPDLCLNELIESPLKRYSVNSGHPITSDNLLASVSVSATTSLSKKCSKRSKKCLVSLCACKIRYLTVSICQLPAGIKSMNVKNIGNSLCWFQSSAHMLDSKVGHKRTKNNLKQLHSNSDIIRLQSNSDCKQLQSCNYLKQLQSQNFKHHKSKSDVKCAKLSHGKKHLAVTGGDRQCQSKCDVQHRKTNKCKDSSHEADIEEHDKVTEEKDSCGVIHKSRNVSVKRKSLESYNCNAGQMQHASFTKTERQNPVHLCRISDFYRPLKKRLNLQHQHSVKVTDTIYGSSDSTVHESPLSHCVSASGFHSVKDKLDSCMSTFCCHTVFSSGKHNQKLCDTSENLIAKNHHTRRKVKCKITGKSECRSQQHHWRPCYSAFHRVYRPTPVRCKYVFPNSCHKQSSVCYQKHRRRSTNTEARGKGVLTNQAGRILSHHRSSYLTDIQNRLPQCYSESGVKPDCRNLFDTFLNEIPSTSQPNLTEEITSKPEMSSIQTSGKHHNNDQALESDYSAKDLGLLEPSDLSVQVRTENSGTELFEPSARLLDTNDDTYSDISDDILPDAVSNTYDMFSDISDCIPDNVPVNESINGDKLLDKGRNMLPSSGALWANDLHSLWLQSPCFSLLTSNISLEILKTNATKSHNEKIKEALLTPEDSSCSDNHDNALNCQKPCSTVIQNNLPVSDNTCHTEIQTNSSSQSRPCSFMVTTISEGPCCSEVEEGNSMSKRRSSGEIQTSEGPSSSDRPCCFMENPTSEKPGSTESMKDSSLCERPGSFGINQTSVFTSDSVESFSGCVQQGGSPTLPGAAEESMASDGPCTYKQQRLHSHGRPCSNESHDGISPCGIPYSLEMNQKLVKSTSEGLCSYESDEKTLNFAVRYFNAVESTNKGSLSTKLQEEAVTSCANYIQNESAFGMQSSVEILGKTLPHEEPLHLLKAQQGLSIAKEIVYMQNDSTICEHSSSEIPGKALACKTPCSVETQKRVSISEESVSIQIQNELLAFSSGNILDTIHNSEGFRSSNICKENLTYEGPYESGVNDAEQVLGMPCSGESCVLEMPFSEEGPLVSEICNAKEGHLVLGATYSKEGSLVSDMTCSKEGSLTSEGPCCKVGPLVSEVISEDSCSREELFISEEPCCEERPLVSEGPGSYNGPLISDRSYPSDGLLVSNLRCIEEGCFTSEAPCSGGILVSEAPCLTVTQKEILAADAKFSGVVHEGHMIHEVPGSGMLQIGLIGSQEGFSSVREVEDLLTAGVSCLSETTDVSLNLEDLFPFVLQEPSEGFDDPLNYENFLSCEMQEGTPVGSQIDNTQENSLIAPTSCIATFQEEFSKSDIQKGLLTSGNSSCKELRVPETNEMNSNQVDASSHSESFLDKFYEFTNVWRPSAAPESESDGDNADNENYVDSLDEIRNECITDVNRTSCETVPFMCQVNMPLCPARAKTESWLQEYQSQMLENQQKTHKNWKLLASVNDDPGSGRRCGQRKGASENRSRKRKSSPGADKTRHQPKRVCTMTHNSEQTESERFMVLQQDLCGVDLTSQSNFSVDGVMANFQNMILNGDPNLLSVFIDQANTWLSMENIETTIDVADLGHNGLNIHSERELTVPLASDSLTSDDNTLSIESRQSDLLDLASALPMQQPESIMPSGLPGLALNSAASTDAQTFAMLSENGGNVESLNALSSDAGSTSQTVVPGFKDVPELDAEMLQYLWSVFPQASPSGELPAISYIKSNGIVTNTDVNRGIIYVLNHSNCFTQLAECSQILGCDPVLECNKGQTGSQCQVGQTFTPVLILTNGNNISAKVDNSTSTEQSDSDVCFPQNSSETMTAGLSEIDSHPAQNSSETMTAGLSEIDSHPAQNNCPVMDIGEFRASDTVSANNLEQRCMVDVAESNSALLSEKHDALESQQQGSNILVLEKNCEIINNSVSSSAPLTENYSDDCTDQNSAAALLEKGCSGGAVLSEKGSELNRYECSETVLAKRLSCSDSTSVHPLQSDLSNENNQSQNMLPTGNKLLSHQSCDVEQLMDSCRIESASGNSAIPVDQQGNSGSECSSDADLHQMSSAVPSSELNDLSVGEDSLSDKSDPFVLTCDDAGDNAAIFWEDAEQDNCSDISDVIMLECNDSPQSHRKSISETAFFNVAVSPQEHCTAQETDDASKDHVSAVILQKGIQSSSANGNQKTKSFDEGIQENSEEDNQKSANVDSEKSSENGSQKSAEDSEILVEKFNKNCYKGIHNFLEGDNNKPSEEICQALRSGSCEEEVVYSNLTKSSAINEHSVLPNSRPMLLHPHDSVMILVDKLTSKKNSKVKTKLKKSKPINRAEGEESNTTESQLFNMDAPHSIHQNTDKHIDKLPSIEINMVKSKLRKSKPISKAKSKMSSAIEPQGLHVVALDSIARIRNLHDIRQTICSGSVTEPSFDRSEQQTEGNVNKSRAKETSYSSVQTVEPAKVNSCTIHTRTLKRCQNGIKLRIVKLRSGIWQTKSSSDPITLQDCSHKDKSVASASNDDCTVSSNNLSSYQEGIYISDESDDDSTDCVFVGELRCPPNNRLTSAKRTIINQRTSFLSTSSSLHRFGCTCLSCAEQQFLYGRDNTMSPLFRDNSLRRGLMRYKPSMPANRSPLQVYSVAPVDQPAVAIEDLNGSNSDMPIHIL